MSIFTIPGTDGRRAHKDLQPGVPLTGTGNVAVDNTPESYEVPFSGVLMLVSSSETRIRVAQDPTDLALATDFRIDSILNEWRYVPVRAGQFVSFFSPSTTNISAFMAARDEDVNDFS